MCSSEQNHTAEPSDSDGLPWSMPSAFSPQSATAQPPGLTDTTVARMLSACPKGRPMAA
jgi:hypothetical protein